MLHCDKKFYVWISLRSDEDHEVAKIILEEARVVITGQE